MKIKNSNFYLSVTFVLIFSICFAVTPSQAGSAVASGSAGSVSATGQVYLHLSDGSVPYVTGFGMVEIDVVGGDFQVVEGELWASYETSLTNNQISVVAAGGSDQMKIVLARGQIGDDPSTSDTFETIYIPSDDTESKPSEKGSENGNDPHAKKHALRDMQTHSGEPTSEPTLLIRDESQETRQDEEEKPSVKGDDPHAEKRAARDEQTRTSDEDQNTDENPDDPQQSSDESDESEE